MKYRKKPVIIEAIQWDGTNNNDISLFTGGQAQFNCLGGFLWCHIETPESKMNADQNDYIIKGIAGEFYPCKPDIFEMTYEKIDE